MPRSSVHLYPPVRGGLELYQSEGPKIVTSDGIVTRLREAWQAGEPRLSPTSNMILAYVNSRPGGTRAADVLPLLLDAGEAMPDRESDRYVRVASKAKMYLRGAAWS